VLKRTEPKINLGYSVGGTAGDERCCIFGWTDQIGTRDKNYG